MPLISDAPWDAWKSLYTEEVQSIWNLEKKELRNVAMVFFVLKQEFARIECNLNRELDNFRDEIKLIDNLKRYGAPSSVKSSTKEPLQINNTEESQLSKSPKLNKYRKDSYVKKPKSSPSLLSVLNESKSNKAGLPVPIIQERPTSEDLFNSSNCDSPLNQNTSEISSKNNKLEEFKTPQGIKRLINEDVVESSFIVEDTPNKLTEKKYKWNRKHTSLKGNKSSKSKVNKSLTLMQMFDTFPNQRIKVNIRSSNYEKKNAEKTTKNQNKSEEKNSVDGTYLPSEEEYQDTSSKNIQHKENFPIPDAFFKNYDKIPEQKSTSPQHVHKTETVRGKIERKKLPGWSCSDCEKYYKGLDLSPEELRKKMNVCSKHRNKFPLLDTTPKGFWDVTMPPTQESQDNETTFFNC